MRLGTIFSSRRPRSRVYRLAGGGRWWERVAKWRAGRRRVRAQPRSVLDDIDAANIRVIRDAHQKWQRSRQPDDIDFLKADRGVWETHGVRNVFPGNIGVAAFLWDDVLARAVTATTLATHQG